MNPMVSALAASVQTVVNGERSVKDVAFSVRGCSADYVPTPWLNLLFYLPISRALRGQSEPVWRYAMRKHMYDMPRHFPVSCLLKKLREIFPRSFLFRLEPLQIPYRDDWLSHAEPYQALAAFDEFRVDSPNRTNIVRLIARLKPGAPVHMRFDILILCEK
jgi:hypothetical protein